MQNRNRWGLVLLVIATLLVAACGGKPATAKVEAARLEPVPGSDVKRLVLTEQAAKRTGIELEPLREEQVTRKRLVGGEIITPAGSFAVRVRLSVSDFETVDATVPAKVQPVSAASGAPGRTVIAQPLPVTAPVVPTGAAAAAVLAIPVDFTLTGVEHSFAGAERVMVELSLKGGGLNKVVPYSALIYELNGDTWVYTSPEPLVFVRQRVVVSYIDGNRAVLSEGPPPGTQVVVVGATELYGTEFRVGK